MQVVHAIFHVGLLIAPRRHAEPGIESIVAGQRLVPWVQLTLATLQDRGGYRARIVPPNLPGHTTEEGQAFDHASQNRLRAFARQRHREAKAGIAPRQDQNGYLPTSVREVYVDVAEVGLQTPAGRMGQGKERLLSVPAVLADVPPHLVITAQIALFIPQTPVKLGGGVTLLDRSVLIIG